MYFSFRRAHLAFIMGLILGDFAWVLDNSTLGSLACKGINKIYT